MSVQTIRLLYEFLTGTLENMEIPTDLFIEIFQMFKRLKGEVVPLPSPQRIKSRNDRWETGLDEEVREVRDENKERMLHLLIQKIENRKSKPSVRFHFEEGMSYEEKYRLVNEWWNDFRFHLAMAVKSPGELNRFLEIHFRQRLCICFIVPGRRGCHFCDSLLFIVTQCNGIWI